MTTPAEPPGGAGPGPGPTVLGGTPLFWAGLAVGWAIMAVGIRSALSERLARAPALARFVLGFAVVHDFVVLPAAVVLAVLTARLVPAVARVPVRLALALSWLLVLISWPAARRYGARPDNPTVLPVDVGRNLVILLAAIWLLAALDVARRVVGARRDRSPAAGV